MTSVILAQDGKQKELVSHGRKISEWLDIWDLVGSYIYIPTLDTVFFLLPKTSHLGTLSSNR